VLLFMISAMSAFDGDVGSLSLPCDCGDEHRQLASAQ
jgi:hypothetical protein